MHDPVDAFPKGTVLGSCRLAKGKHVVDVVRLRHGSTTRFVESVTHHGRYGPTRTAMRRSDDFPSDAIADRFIGYWLDGAVSNRSYRVVHKDPGFEKQAGSGSE